MGAVTNIILLIILLVVVIVFLPKIMDFIQVGKSILSNSNGPNLNFTTTPNGTISQNTTSGPLVGYALGLINRDRQKYGLANVTLSPITSAQQHADSMLEYNYFSHWDIYGMKPYMRYAILGGKGAVQENVAYSKSGLNACIGTFCTTYGNLNTTGAVNQLEYSMMYNDSICCNNGHRDNILDPNHNQVSIGVAYNSTAIYFVEDFIDNYITWFNNTPSFSSNEVYMKGSVGSNYSFSDVEVSYDPPVVNMTQQQLSQTSEYSYGTAVAGVVGSALDYYPSLTTIVADNYYKNANNFLVSFNMQKLIAQYGAGEYTMAVWLNGTAQNSSFVGATYTIFINANGTEYFPQSV